MNVLNVNEPPALDRIMIEALASIIYLHGEQIRRDPANADWYRTDIQRVQAELCRRMEQR